jgi:hypothetical protein
MKTTTIRFKEILLMAIALVGGLLPATSTDLVWHIRAPEILGSTTSFMRVAYGEGMFVAAGYDGSFAVSNDGSNWRTNMPTNAVPWIGLGYAAGQFMAVGGGPTTLVSSTDGTNWVSQPFPDVNAVPSELCSANDTFWLCVRSQVDQSRSLFVSTNGTNWVRTAGEFFSGAPGAYYSVAYGSGLYACVGWDTSYFGGPNPGYSAPTIKVSSDATNWITEFTGVDPADLTNARDGTGLQRVTYGDKFVAVANNCHVYNNFTSGRGIWYSGDGTNWTYEITTFPDLRSVACGNGTYVAVGGYSGFGIPGVVLTSPDGVQWNSAAISSTNYLTDVVFGQGTFVAVGTFGQIFQSDPVLSLRPGGQPGGILIYGAVGQSCAIESTEALADPSVWNSLGSTVITNYPMLWTDPTPASNASRFYRARLIQ